MRAKFKQILKNTVKYTVKYSLIKLTKSYSYIRYLLVFNY